VSDFGQLFFFGAEETILHVLIKFVVCASKLGRIQEFGILESTCTLYLPGMGGKGPSLNTTPEGGAKARHTATPVSYCDTPSDPPTQIGSSTSTVHLSPLCCMWRHYGHPDKNWRGIFSQPLHFTHASNVPVLY
jgi:hypothetical protein